MMKHGIWIALSVAIGAWVAPAAGQSCPSEYTTCDNGGCCLSSEQCCPGIEEGCCSSATPYCCGDGTCAATPSQCEINGRSTGCDGYDVPCGAGCAPAGSECCDPLGHYCPPESMCTSDTTCVFGDMARLALEVAAISPAEAAAARRLSPPFEDPPDATERSCGLAPRGQRSPSTPWLLGLAAALLSLRRRPLPESSAP